MGRGSSRRFNLSVALLSGQTYDLEARPHHKVSYILSQLSERITFVSWLEYHLLYDGERLEPEHELRWYGIRNDATVQLIITASRSVAWTDRD